VDETTTVYALAVDANRVAHMPDTAAVALCGVPVVRMMHPAERLTMCKTCGAAAFRWN